jgi:hypothetical protein
MGLNAFIGSKNSLKKMLPFVLLVFYSRQLPSAEVPNLTEILSHKNRKLEPPPRNIKSDRFDPSERFEVALQRSETAVAVTRDGSDEESLNSRYQVLLGTNRKIADKSVSIGVLSGGSSGLVGGRIDFSLPPFWVSASVGSGLDYSSWGLGIRKYLFPRLAVLPFVDFRYSEWLLKKANSQRADFPYPQYATKSFFSNPFDKQTAHLVSPGLGMAYIGKDGFGLEVGAQYTWSFDMEQGAVLGSLGLVRYF